MAGFAEWQMEPAVAAGLERLGWGADAPEVRDAVPTALRGGNLVAILPPSPAWATPIVAGVIGRPAVDGPLLILAPAAQLGEWAMTIGALLESTDLQVEVVRESVGAPSAASASRVVIASPESALARHSGSALHPEQFRAILFAWPEDWHADDAVAALLQDVARDSQRVVLTARRDRLDGADGIVERYARKAVVVAPAAADSAPATGRPLSVRTVSTPWSTRAATTAAALEQLVTATSVTIWTADQRDHQLIRRALGSLRPGVALAARTVPATGTIVCYDLPSVLQLARLSTVGEVVLLVPPGTEDYVLRTAPSRRPMVVSSPARAVADRDATLRQRIEASVDSGDHGAALYALAPLFEHLDPQAVAAALFDLWQAKTVATAPAPAAPVAEAQAPRGVATMAKIWIGAGKQDDATVADFVAVLVREVGIDRSRIGRIELRDTFALVEVPAADAEAIVLRLSGITIRKRKLTARIDQGRGGGKPPRH